jgi:hypothetical protein
MSSQLAQRVRERERDGKKDEESRVKKTKFIK